MGDSIKSILSSMDKMVFDDFSRFDMALFCLRIRSFAKQPVFVASAAPKICAAFMKSMISSLLITTDPH